MGFDSLMPRVIMFPISIIFEILEIIRYERSFLW